MGDMVPKPTHLLVSFRAISDGAPERLATFVICAVDVPVLSVIF